MDETSPLVKTLCLKYCSYYKPSKNEELACRGFRVVERFMQSGRTIVMENPGVSVDKQVMDQLVQSLCSVCTFHEYDCDYFQDRVSHPCGGFVLLSQLLGSGKITIAEIKQDIS
ncbi:MAG TPA: hypothetical protein VMM54_12640 [Nitrospirota bacterium]|nr:hypothetical protein [Nitrospirota bacterium]